jgi:CBS domain-containing protein
MPIGIITEHEICLQVIGNGRNPRTLTAANVMNTNVVKASYTLSVTDCSHLLETNQAERALVINEDGMFCGTLTHLDLETTKNKQRVENSIDRDIYETHNASRANRIY